MLCQALTSLGGLDLAGAVANGRKYHRLEDLLGGLVPEYEGAVGLRLAFNPNAAVPSSKEEWIKEALAKYAEEEDLQRIMVEWPVYQEIAARTARIRKKRAETKAAAEAAKTRAARRKHPTGSHRIPARSGRSPGRRRGKR